MLGNGQKTVTLKKGTLLFYRDKMKRDFSVGYIVVFSVEENGFTFFYNNKQHELGFDAINTRLFFTSALGKMKYQTATNQPTIIENAEISEEQDTPQDIELVCAACGKPFVWTVEEQKYYDEMLYDPPKTCSRACRERRRRAREQALINMEIANLMQPSGNYRTGAAGRTTVSVSGGKPKEISDWALDNIAKGYSYQF